MTAIPFTPVELAFMVLYLLSLLAIGALGMMARKENTLKDFYLAGPGIGFFVLLMTLYSTQYSGNTLFGFTGRTYSSDGYKWLVSVHFMTAIVVLCLLFAPRLHRLAKQHTFITPADFVHHRFGWRPLTIVASLLMMIAIANYLLAQLKAMGAALEGFVPSHAYTAYVVGVISLTLIIIVYETLGGFRAVAWTDVIQGCVLMTGFAVLVVLVFQRFGTLQDATTKLMTEQPEKINPPDVAGSLTWLSWILIVGLGGCLYPQAIQRIYAARSTTSLRRSMALMVFMPLTTTLIAVVFGIMAAAAIPIDEVISEVQKTEAAIDASDAGATKATASESPADGAPVNAATTKKPLSKRAAGDKILTVVCRKILEGQPGEPASLFNRWLVVVLFSGVLAALMSTADSVLLCISSMFTKDIYGGLINRAATQKQLTRVGKLCSWAVIGMMAGAAIAMRDVSLVALLKLKFELLVQLAPAFILGNLWQRLSAKPVFAGLLAGVAVAVTIAFLPKPFNMPLGVHAGVWGLYINLIVATTMSLLMPVGKRDLKSTV